MAREINLNGKAGKETEYRRGTGIAQGLVIGAGFGVAMGTVLDNLGLGIAVGTAFGIAIGAAMDQRRMAEAGRSTAGSGGRRLVAVAAGGLSLLAAGLVLYYILSTFAR
jgi:type IV secretory pathway TrbL component